MPTLTCLRQEIVSGTNRYPIFIGFASAADILQVAEAPAFTPTTSHSDISNNILTPPVRDWQRPLDEGRVAAIARVYDNTGELMPNPVLLCENVLFAPSGILISQQTSGGIPTNSWNVEVPLVPTGTPKPLWILDGQHRINGLAHSAQRNNALPVVLLINQNAAAYSGPLVAKLFAQVTTAATPLDELHDEWLTFAFGLRDYDPAHPNADSERRAMKCVAELCRRPTWANNVTNPFHNQIRFNRLWQGACGPRPGGFSYDCVELKDLIYKGYYSVSAPVNGHLAPEVVAEQMALAFIALTQKVTAPQDTSVFFGDSRHGQRIMQDAFLRGVMARLIAHGTTTDWSTLLDTLRFSLTNWNFNWVRSLNGTAATISRALAIDVFVETFRSGALPTPTGTLSDYLQGNDAKIEICFSSVNATGRVIPQGRATQNINAGSRLSASITPATHFRITKKSGNIGRLEIIDQQHPPGNPLYYRENGEKLTAPSTNYPCSNPLILILRMHHYGGVQGEATFSITW